MDLTTCVGGEAPDENTSLMDAKCSSEDDVETNCTGTLPPPLPTYTLRREEFKRFFKEVPDSERLLVDYPCALQRDILLQGRLYLTDNWLCFYSNVFRGTKFTLLLKDIEQLTKEKTARLIPNAMVVRTTMERLFLTSFSAREKSYLEVFRMWQNALMDKPLTPKESLQMVQQHYGTELGLSHEEMDSLRFSAESSMQSSVAARSAGGDTTLARPETSSPQDKDFPSPSDSRKVAIEHDHPRTSLDRFIPERGSKRCSPAPERSTTGERGSKRCSPAPEHSNNGERGSKRCSPAPEHSNNGERGSKRCSPAPEHSNNGERGSKRCSSAPERSTSGESEDSVEEEEGVGVPQEEGRRYLNRVFHVSASRMFQLLFSDSAFIRSFMNVRKITEPTFTEWQKNPAGNSERSLNYTITISNPLIGKFSTATEKQTLYKDSQDGHYYLVDSEVYTHDVPYSEYFYTHNRYYIRRHSKHKCRLTVFTDVKYKKQPWSLIKSFITKNSWNGIEDYFRELETELLEEENVITQGGGDSGKVGGLLRRRRRTLSRTLLQHMKPNKPDQHSDGGVQTSNPARWNLPSMVAAMSVILLIVTLLNVALFYKLWAMEDVAQRIYLTTKHRLRDSAVPESTSRPGPAFMTGEEAQLLQSVLQNSIKLLEQLRTSLILLQHNFANQTRQ
ncbi:protein Aster-C [Entelurus aequoreus]|uniref:protein Aster-C n=1 Tax=Entelurus aequoreus TaxID=161455 RepID=UPI002B1E2AD7|nr:protein Aster-C [Entelurus aequoreus]